jgi:transcriptional regulator with XRE-family HTH domain
MNINERIIAKTKELGISQVELAKRTGLTKGAVNQWFKGLSAPNGENLLKTAVALGESPEWLQTGKEARSRVDMQAVPIDMNALISIATETYLPELVRLQELQENGVLEPSDIEMLRVIINRYKDRK